MKLTYHCGHDIYAPLDYCYILDHHCTPHSLRLDPAGNLRTGGDTQKRTEKMRRFCYILCSMTKKYWDFGHRLLLARGIFEIGLSFGMCMKSWLLNGSMDLISSLFKV